MCEDHLYWAGLHARWMVDENFDKGPAQFFGGAPKEAKRGFQEGMKRTLHGQGFGRHEDAEIADLAHRTDQLYRLRGLKRRV